MEQVFCRYFRYEQHEAGSVLEALVRKTETIHKQVSSVGQVIEKRIALCDLIKIYVARTVNYPVLPSNFLRFFRLDLSDRRERLSDRRARVIGAMTIEPSLRRRQAKLAPDFYQGLALRNSQCGEPHLA
jgi:hypothetical protein